ncbi:MAG TPA: tetratricopeptide repeat protein [Anaerolineae bacterium]|nr:tetratricopeptide repeat protein [Anaerolineae bacterium]HQK13847.1 tetratricopeptide repeat protein [Anaerolineae bacterium]
MGLNHPAFLILSVGLLYILGFGGLSLLRRQGLSMRFAIESLIVTGLGAALTFAYPRFPPLLFLIVLYLVTMRVRLLTDLANAFLARKNFPRAQATYRLALRLWPDAVSRQIVLINRGVAELRAAEPETAYTTLTEALGNQEFKIGAHYLSAGYYNLGLAARRTGHEAEAIRHFNEAIDALPHSIYAQAARRALKEHPSKQEPQSTDITDAR